MNHDLRNLALVSFGIQLDPALKEACLQEILALPKQQWYHCEFRHCDLLLLYGGAEILDKENLTWKHGGVSFDSVGTLIRSHIQPFFKTIPRLIVLKTSPGQQMTWHIDCNENETHILQPKMRFLLQGRPEDLYFMGKDGGEVRSVPEGDMYYMSGSYVHSLRNNSDEDRYVLCLGSPWGEQDLKSEFLDLVRAQPESRCLWKESLYDGVLRPYARDPRAHRLVAYE